MLHAVRGKGGKGKLKLKNIAKLQRLAIFQPEYASLKTIILYAVHHILHGCSILSLTYKLILCTEYRVIHHNEHGSSLKRQGVGFLGLYVFPMLTISSAPGFRENRVYSRAGLSRAVATYIWSITTSATVLQSGDFPRFSTRRGI